MQTYKPDRLNLAIARHCFVHCKGCYSYFGKHEPDLTALAKTVASFVQLGIQDVTISGGDPLTIKGLIDFLLAIRAENVRTIKIDTVGTSILFDRISHSARNIESIKNYIDILFSLIDYLGIPLDGWSNRSCGQFREGRPFLYDETIRLLEIFDFARKTPNIIINTVLHKQNIHGLELILDEIYKHRSICHWNIFQYTATDQIPSQVNVLFKITDEQFTHVCSDFFLVLAQKHWRSFPPTIEFCGVKSRLGKYLLINSDGNVWMPDEIGCTIYLGSVFGREEEVLEQWSNRASKMIQSQDNTTLLPATQALLDV